MIGLAVQLIERQNGAYDPSDFEDRYETRLRALIAAKASGKPLKQPAMLPAPDNVIDLMAALKRSLAGDATEMPVAKAAPVRKRAAKRA
jgi:DNA end-binding protein Ku